MTTKPARHVGEPTTDRGDAVASNTPTRCLRLQTCTNCLRLHAHTLPAPADVHTLPPTACPHAHVLHHVHDARRGVRGLEGGGLLRVLLQLPPVPGLCTHTHAYPRPYNHDAGRGEAATGVGPRAHTLPLRHGAGKSSHQQALRNRGTGPERSRTSFFFREMVMRSALTINRDPAVSCSARNAKCPPSMAREQRTSGVAGRKQACGVQATKSVV